MSKEPKTDQEKITKLSELLKDVQIAMLTTVGSDGNLYSRPMAYQAPDGEFDGTLYFFTRADSPKADEVQREDKVNVAFAEPKPYKGQLGIFEVPDSFAGTLHRRAPMGAGNLFAEVAG